MRSALSASVGLIGLALFATWITEGHLARAAWSDRSLADARGERGLRIGYAVEAPYAFVTADGQVTGESPEVAREIARRLHVSHVEWRLTDFDTLIDGLLAHRYDVIAAGMFKTPERARLVAFSRPTFQVGSALLVPRENPLQLSSYASLAARGSARVAVLRNAVEEHRLEAAGVAPAQLLEVPDALSGALLIRLGKADALALSAPSVRWMAGQAPAQFSAVLLPHDAQSVGVGAFAFRSEDRALREAWDRALEGFVGTPDHLRLAANFGFTPAELLAPAQESR